MVLVLVRLTAEKKNYGTKISKEDHSFLFGGNTVLVSPILNWPGSVKFSEWDLHCCSMSPSSTSYYTLYFGALSLPPYHFEILWDGMGSIPYGMGFWYFSCQK